jgi:hypothetical protein
MIQTDAHRDSFCTFAQRWWRVELNQSACYKEKIVSLTTDHEEKLNWFLRRLCCGELFNLKLSAFHVSRRLI